MDARRTTARRHARLPGRSVERARRAAARHDRGRRAPEGHPLLEPHARQHRLVSQDAGAAPRGGQAAGCDAEGAAPVGRSRAAGAGSRSQGLQHHPPHLSRQAIRGLVEGLRVLAAHDGRALEGRLQRHGAHPASSRGARSVRKVPMAFSPSTSSIKVANRRSDDETGRCPQESLRHAAQRPVLSQGSVQVLQPRIRRHQLPYRPGAPARGRARAARGGGRHGELRVHPHARFDGLRRLYRNRPGDPGALQGQGRHGAGRRLRARHVSRRQLADRRRPRDLGLPEEARQPQGLPRERDAALHAALRLGALRHRHHGLQAPRDRSGAAAQEPGQAQLHDQDHPARRLHATHLRAGALLPRGRDGEGRVVRTRPRCSSSITPCATSTACPSSKSCRPATSSPT